MKDEEKSFGITSLELNSTASSADSLSTSYSSCSSLDTSDLNYYDSIENSKAKPTTIDKLNISKNEKFWRIRAKVTFKSPIKKWSNCFSRGKYFHLELRDETASIKAVAFKEACDEFYPALEVNKIYNISGCKIKPANKTYSTLPHDCELVFEKRGVILSQYNQSAERSSCQASKCQVEYSEPITIYSSLLDVKNAKRGMCSEIFHVESIIVDFIMRDINQVVYKACPSDYCKKKVVPTKDKNGLYYCSKCAEKFPSFEYQYMLKVEIADCTGSVVITMFESAERLLGIQASDLVQIFEKNQEEYRDYFRKNLLKRYCFIIEAKKQLYKNEGQTNAVGVDFYEIDYRDVSRSLLQKIHEITKNGQLITS